MRLCIVICAYVFPSTVDDGAKPKAHYKHAQKTLDTSHFHERKIYYTRTWGLKKRGRHLLERGVFSGTCGTTLFLHLPSVVTRLLHLPHDGPGIYMGKVLSWGVGI